MTGVSQFYTCKNTRFNLTSLACIDIPRNTPIERLNMSHMNDMINMLMFTIETTSSLVMIGFDVVDLGRVSLIN